MTCRLNARKRLSSKHAQEAALEVRCYAASTAKAAEPIGTSQRWPEKGDLSNRSEHHPPCLALVA
jgi:hypothetical protein